MNVENKKMARLLAVLSGNVDKASRKKKAEKAKAGKKAVGLTAKQILGNTPSDVKDRAKEVRINKSSTGLSRKGNAQIIFDTESHSPTTKRRPPKHRTIIRLLNRQYRKLWVSCTCEYWMFYCEYAMAKFGASDIIHSNGQPPVVTNPGNWPYGCKHVTRVLNRKSIVDKLVKLDKKFADLQH